MTPSTASLDRESARSSRALLKAVVAPDASLLESPDVDKLTLAHVSNSSTEASTVSSSSEDNSEFNVPNAVTERFPTPSVGSVRSIISRTSSNRSFHIPSSPRHRISTGESYLNRLQNRVADVVIAEKQAEYDIKNYKMLRSPEDYARGVFLKVRRKKLMEGMMHSSTSVIPRSLSKLDDGLSVVATRMNRAILGYCGDKSVSFPTTLAQDVLLKAMNTLMLMDELYLQLCKHLTFNPSQESTGRAWHLLCLAVGCFPPSKDLEFCLLNFLSQYLDAPGFIGLYASYAERRLEGMLSVGSSLYVPSIEEIQGFKYRPPVLTSIRLVDGLEFTQDMPVTPNQDINDMLGTCAIFLELPQAVAKLFGLYLEVGPLQDDRGSVVMDPVGPFVSPRPSASSSVTSSQSGLSPLPGDGVGVPESPATRRKKQKSAKLRPLWGHEYLGDIIMTSARWKQSAEGKRARRARRRFWKKRKNGKSSKRLNASMTSVGSTVESHGVSSMENLEEEDVHPWFRQGKPATKIPKPVLVLRCKYFFPEDWPSPDSFVNRLLFLQAEQDVNIGRIQFSSAINSTQLLALNVISLLINQVVMYRSDLGDGEDDHHIADSRSVTSEATLTFSGSMQEDLQILQNTLDQHMNLVKRLLKPKQVLRYAPHSLMLRTGAKSHSDLARRVIKSGENLIRAKMKALRHTPPEDIYADDGDMILYFRNILHSMYLEKVVLLTEELFGCSEFFAAEQCEWEGSGIPEHSGNLPGSVLIGVNSQGLHIVNPLNRSSDGLYLSIDFDMMHSWGSSQGEFYLNVVTVERFDDFVETKNSQTGQSMNSLGSSLSKSARSHKMSRNARGSDIPMELRSKVVLRRESSPNLTSHLTAPTSVTRNYTFKCCSKNAETISNMIFEYAAELENRSRLNSTSSQMSR